MYSSLKKFATVVSISPQLSLTIITIFEVMSSPSAYAVPLSAGSSPSVRHSVSRRASAVFLGCFMLGSSFGLSGAAPCGAAGASVYLTGLLLRFSIIIISNSSDIKKPGTVSYRVQIMVSRLKIIPE